MVLDPIPQSLPVHFFGSRPQPPTSRQEHAKLCPSHGTYMNESWHIYEWVMSHIWLSHITQRWQVVQSARNQAEGFELDEQQWEAEWQVSHVTHVTVSWRMHSCDLHMDELLHIRMSYSHTWMSFLHIWKDHVVLMRESFCAYEWVMSHPWVSHVAHMKESCHIYECAMSHV